MGSLAKAIKQASNVTGYHVLRDYQKKTVEVYLSGRDVFVSAPTGAGKSSFSSPEAALLLVSTKNHDLWPGPTPEVRDSRTSRHSAHAQS